MTNEILEKIAVRDGLLHVIKENNDENLKVFFQQVKK